MRSVDVFIELPSEDDQVPWAPAVLLVGSSVARDIHDWLTRSEHPPNEREDAYYLASGKSEEVIQVCAMHHYEYSLGTYESMMQDVQQLKFQVTVDCQ